jgi:hypothetical protein
MRGLQARTSSSMCMCVYVHVYICVCLCVCIYMCTCVRAHTCMYIYIYICMYVHTYIYTCMCIYISCVCVTHRRMRVDNIPFPRRQEAAGGKQCCICFQHLCPVGCGVTTFEKIDGISGFQKHWCGSCHNVPPPPPPRPCFLLCGSPVG